MAEDKLTTNSNPQQHHQHQQVAETTTAAPSFKLIKATTKILAENSVADNNNMDKQEKSVVPAITTTVPVDNNRLDLLVKSNQNKNENRNYNNDNHQQQQKKHHRRQLSDKIEVSVVVSSQYENRPQYAQPIIIKQTNFFAPIYDVLGFTTKNKDNKPEFTPKEIGTLIMFILLLTIFMTSGIGVFIMWFTDVYNSQYTSKLVLSNNSVAAKWWTHPPISPHLKVHIFNYTNIDKFTKGIDKKLKLVDLGPYVYAENSTKVNVVFNNNHTITYKEHRSYRFIPELSSGKQYDQVVVPNVPLLSAIASIKNEQVFLKSFLGLALSSTKMEPFKVLAADSLLWGYDDDLINFLKTFSAKSVRFEKFGMLINRNGTSADTFQIYNGEDDLRKLAIISQFNGKRSMNFWSTDECNRLDGTDGSQFPPYLLDKKKRLEVYIQALCRKLPLVFDSEVNVFDGVPAWRYKTPLNVFAHPNDNPDNQCYCHIESGVCPPSGLFNGTKCYEAPIFVSFPHFFSGEPALYEDFEGIQPNATIHQTFADIHPRLAFPIDGASRIQINIQLYKEKLIAQKLNRFKEEMILPVIWIEVTSGELTAELRALIYHSSFSANAIQLALKYGTLLTFVTSFALLMIACYYRIKPSIPSSSSTPSPLTPPPSMPTSPASMTPSLSIKSIKPEVIICENLEIIESTAEEVTEGTIIDNNTMSNL